MNLPPYEKFDCHSEGTAVRWTRWVRRLEHIFDGYEIAQSKRKYALTYGGPDLNDIVESLPNNEQIEASDDPYKDLIDALNDHFNPQSNVEILKYQFRHKTQTPGSKIDDFYAELRQLAAQCKFVNPEDEIKSQIEKIELREKGLTTPIDLINLLKFARTLEMTEEYGKQLAANHQQINKIFDKSKSRSRPATRHAPSTSKQRTISSQQCRNFGGNWPHPGGQSKCPAFNKTCHKCSKLHHFASVCKSSFSSSETKPIKFNNKSQRYAHSHQKKNVRSIQEFEQNPDEEDDYIFYVNHEASKLAHVNVRINSTAISVLADSGASTNIISQEDFSKIDPTPKLRQATCKIFSYASSKPLETVGVFDAVIQAPNGLSCKSKVNVIKQTRTPILGWPVCQNLEILKPTQHVNHLNWRTSSSVVKQYPEVFSNKIRKLKDVEISLHIDKTVRPVAQPHRRIPFQLRGKVEKELERLQDLGIIRKAEGPTPWISPIVVIPKGNYEIRICIDNRCANKAIQRERHITPTLDDLVNDLNGAMMFSKIDLKMATINWN